jgi:hypothetical protein
MDRRLRNGLATVAIAVAAAPAGYAIAESASSDGDTPPGVVAAADCPDAQAVFAKAGFKFDTFSAPCPTADEAQAQVDQIKQSDAEQLPYLRAACKDVEQSGGENGVCTDAFGKNGLEGYDPSADTVSGDETSPQAK